MHGFSITGVRADAGAPARDPGGRMRLAAIVVYFRTPKTLATCLEALRGQTAPPGEVVVIDNSSALDRLDQRPAPGTDWRWVRSDSNLGFGAACNLGARITASDYLLFLNADLTLNETACERLCSVADRQPQVGVVAPRLFGADGAIELSARAFPTASTGLVGRSSFLTKALAKIGRTPSGVARALGGGGPVDWVSGASMLFRRQAFEQVSGFDEAYWMYWEDADICRRLRDRGWSTILSPEAEAYHATGSSGKNESTIAAFHASAARYYERHLARTRVDARLARAALHARMKLMLRRHAG
jgi:GT2 family glycosyltransferase